MYLLLFVLITTSLFSLDHITASWEYNTNKQIDSLTLFSDQPQPRTTSYTYTPQGKIASIHKPDAVTLNYIYDEWDNLISLDSSDNTVHISYQGDESAEPPQPGIIYKYDEKGLPLSLTLPDKSSILYEWKENKMTAIHRRDPQGTIVYTHRYNWERETLIRSQLPFDLGDVTYSYDLEGHFREISSPYYQEVIPTGGYDQDGRICLLLETDPLGDISHQVTYDQEGQTILEKWGEKVTTYTYDPLQNRQTKNDTRYITDCYNQTLSTPSHNYTYNLNGYVSRVDELQLTYDALDRLTTIENPKQWRVEYSYDAIHRRRSKKTSIWKQETWIFQSELFYLYDHLREMGTIDQEGKIIELRILGTGIGADIGATVAIEKEGKIFIPLHDHRGNIRTLINPLTKKPAQTYRYNAFGEELLDNSTPLSSWRFSSKRVDPETGWIYYGKRYYSPDLARWTSPDPLGLGNHSNAYLFLSNRPIDQIDFYGLLSLSAVWQNIVHTCQKWSDALSSWYQPLSFENLSDQFYKRAMGRGLYRLSPLFSNEDPSSGTFPGKRDDKLRITFINGILNDSIDLTDDILPKIAKMHDGHEIHYIYRGTQGWTLDIFNCILSKIGIIGNHSIKLATIWKKMIEELGGTEGGGKIIHYAHSIGATETLRARLLLSPEEQKMISVISYGPPTMLPSTGFSSVTNHVAKRDGVCLLDPIGFTSAVCKRPDHVIFLGAFLGGYPVVDHLFENYWYYLKEVFEEKS